MKYDGNDEVTATQPPSSSPSPSPSPVDPTRTAEPTQDPDAIPPREPPTAPQRRDATRYRILGEHGRGGLGRVSRAHDRELGRDIAIKELISRGDVSEVRFLREALITARLEHPGIVPVYEAGRWADGTPFYAMKLVAGRPLRDLIAERKTVDERIGLLHHVIAVADAIAYAHGRSIIHRDLKPSNVIVGDFGETVVIDWGLAKDLTAAEESTVGGGPFRASRDDGLTSAGSVLGTPAYMAPEQARGEPVDQRADVHAIGAMLWELCSPQKLPPSSSGQRRRLLRRAGIDHDLAAIVEKACEPDPARRYPDAGALASDLRAFKAGARIAARSYSLFELLTRWTRRNRKLATATIGALVFAIAGVALYVHSVAVERDRADASEETARLARASSQASLDALTLKHAQLLLTSDPSASLDTLATYRGGEVDRARQVRAEAMGRGVSLLRATAHTGMVRWTEATPDGVIFSLGADGTIARTTPDGRSEILSRNVARFAQLSYSSIRHLLAYACDSSDLCFYEILHNTSIPAAPLLRGIHAVGISFSQDGAFLAVMSQDTTLRVFDVTVPTEPRLRLIKAIHGGSDVVFYRDDVVVAGTLKGVEFVHMDGVSEPFEIPNNSYWHADPAGKKFALATIQGKAFLFEGPPMRIAARIDLCHGPVVGVQFIPETHDIAYGCRDGHIGIWNLQTNAAVPRTRVEGYADLIRVSPTGDYILTAGGNGAVTVLDLRTNIATSYKGHGSRLTSITPPSSEHSFFISADVWGVLRTWPLPVRFAELATTLNSQFNTAIFDKQSTMVVATTLFPSLTTFSSLSGVRSFGPHEPYNFSFGQSTDGRIFATYGLTELVELWSFPAMTRTHVINTKQGSVTCLNFVPNSDEFITSGHDGRLIRWTSSGSETLIAQLDKPIDLFAILPSGTDAKYAVIFATSDGTLWQTATNGQPVLVRRVDSRVSRLLLLSDQRTLLAGYTNGETIAIDTQTWQYENMLRASGAVREISVTPDAHWVVVGTNDGSIHVAARSAGESSVTKMTWQRLMVRARHLALAPDGLLVAVCSDGAIWLYSIADRLWLFLPIETADFRWVTTSDDGSAAAALDVEGRLFWINLAAARKLLDDRSHQFK